jgi:replicative DNA helicase
MEGEVDKLNELLARAQAAEGAVDWRAVAARLELLRASMERGEAVASVGADLIELGLELRQRAGHLPDIAPETELLSDHLEALKGARGDRPFLGLDCGFNALSMLWNGLCAGLIVLAGQPSSGKTTFCRQIADEVARREKVPVVFVTLEQSREELRVKALSRLTAELAELGACEPLDTLTIIRGGWGRGEVAARRLSALEQAAERYAEFGGNTYVVEGTADTTVEAIREVVVWVLSRHGVVPQPSGPPQCLVVVDYLQKLPLSAEDSRRVGSLREKIDLQVLRLRQLARELASPVLVVSSQARDFYNDASMRVFKESGEIEYSADIAAVLVEKAREESGQRRVARDVMLVTVKNRNGPRGAVAFEFQPQYARFVPKSDTWQPVGPQGMR